MCVYVYICIYMCVYIYIYIILTFVSSPTHTHLLHHSFHLIF